MFLLSYIFGKLINFSQLNKSLLEQMYVGGKSIMNYIITIIKVSFIGMVLALLISTMELNIIELTLYLVAAYFLGYEIGKKKIKSVLSNQDKADITELVPVVDPIKPQCQQLEQNVEILENPSISSNKNTEVLPQVVLSSLQKHSSSEQIQRDRFSNQLLKQKVELDHKKIQSTSYFQTRLESSRNTRFMRKIEKHEIVTDYQLSVQNTANMIVPFKNNPITALSEPQSLLEVVAHQDYNMKFPSPLIQQKFISLGQLNSEWKQQIVPNWILENGRFGKSYSQAKLIGQGGFGRVYEALNLLQEKRYAIKKLVMKGMVKMHELMNEVLIISKFNHPHIVSYFSCWIELATIDDAELVSCSIPTTNFLERQKQIKEEKEMMYVESNSGFTFEEGSKKSKTKSIRKSQNNKTNSMVPYEGLCENSINLIQICTLHIQMQLCETSLHSFMKQRTEVDAAHAFFIFEQIVSGIHFLHSNGIVHRDLKPANILLCKQKGNIKIGDFGLAALVQEHGELIIRQKIGTPLYMAPQMQDGNRIQRKKIDLIDVYAIGVIYYELLHLLNQATQHQRSQKLMFLQCNKVIFTNKDFKQQRKMIKLLTKTINRPNIRQVISSKQMQELKRKYKVNAQ